MLKRMTLLVALARETSSLNNAWRRRGVYRDDDFFAEKSTGKSTTPTGRRVGHGEVRVVGEGRPADLQRPAEGLALDLRTQLRSLLALFRKYDSKKKFQPTATEIPAINIQKIYWHKY